MCVHAAFVFSVGGAAQVQHATPWRTAHASTRFLGGATRRQGTA